MVLPTFLIFQEGFFLSSPFSKLQGHAEVQCPSKSNPLAVSQTVTALGEKTFQEVIKRRFPGCPESCKEWRLGWRCAGAGRDSPSSCVGLPACAMWLCHPQLMDTLTQDLACHSLLILWFAWGRVFSHMSSQNCYVISFMLTPEL